MLSDEAGSISFKISCITVTVSSTVTLKLSFSPPLSEIKKDDKSRHKKKKMGSKKFIMYRADLLFMKICEMMIRDHMVGLNI